MLSFFVVLPSSDARLISPAHLPFLCIPMVHVQGIDPFMFYGICTTACMAAGYIVGPTLGTIIWRALPSTKRAGLSVVDVMDKEFYERIARNRVDVTLQSPTSPVPDYYGAF